VRILVTAGPTREYFDTVRFISNASTGRMGYAIAAAAADRGHQMVLVSGPVVLPAPPVEVVRVTTAAEMLAACEEAFAACDAAVMAAAVSDWRPAVREDHKAAKQTSCHTVELEPTPDICAALGAVKGRRVLVGFAVQDCEPHRRAEQKMVRKRCDAIVLNSPETMGSEKARVEVKLADEPWSEPVTAGKGEIGRLVVELVERLVAARGQ